MEEKIQKSFGSNAERPRSGSGVYAMMGARRRPTAQRGLPATPFGPKRCAWIPFAVRCASSFRCGSVLNSPRTSRYSTRIWQALRLSRCRHWRRRFKRVWCALSRHARVAGSAPLVCGMPGFPVLSIKWPRIKNWWASTPFLCLCQSRYRQRGDEHPHFGAGTGEVPHFTCDPLLRGGHRVEKDSPLPSLPRPSVPSVLRISLVGTNPS